MYLDYMIGASDKFFKSGGNVGKSKKNKYLYIPNQDISKIVLKSKQVIGKNRILDGAYVKGGKHQAKFTDKYKFPIGSVVWDKTHKRYGVVLNNYGDEVFGDHDEIRLDSDGNQNIHTYDKKWNNNGYNLVPYGSEDDKGNGDLTDNKESAVRIIELYANDENLSDNKKYYEDAYKDLLSGKIDGKPYEKNKIRYKQFLESATDNYRREGYNLIEAIDTAFRDLGLETGGEFDKKEFDEVVASNKNIETYPIVNQLTNEEALSLLKELVSIFKEGQKRIIPFYPDLVLTINKEFLDEKVILYNNPKFIESDPIQIPHSFTLKEDIEIAGFLSATIAWGNRKMIINNAKQLMEIMGNSPYDFIVNHKENDLEKLSGFVHRTFNSIDAVYFIKSLQNIYQNYIFVQIIF